jgi:hypothetical protein
MPNPARRILATTVVSLGLAIGVSVGLVGRQQASGRSDLVGRAQAFVRSVQGVRPGDLERDAGPTDPRAFLRPGDQADPQLVARLRVFGAPFRDANTDIPVLRAKVTGDDQAITWTPIGDSVSQLLEVRWVRVDGRWYLDPGGL